MYIRQLVEELYQFYSPKTGWNLPTRREFLGSWINSSAVHEAKKRRAKHFVCFCKNNKRTIMIISDHVSISMLKWLHMIGAPASPGANFAKGRETWTGKRQMSSQQKH
jgi:hypothetical protein